MVFSSMIFLCIFLPVTFGLHLLLPGMRAKNMLLVIASLLFYAYGEPVYVLLLIGSSFFNYLFAWLVERDPGHKKVWVVAAVLANLAVLIIFKYTGFLISSFNSITGAAVPVPQIRMPIGISFFTFQAIVLCDRCIPRYNKGTEELCKGTAVYILLPAADRRTDCQIP